MGIAARLSSWLIMGTLFTVYDHPLARVSTRQSLLTHFILLHLFSTVYIPSLTPSSVLHHAHNVASRLRNRLVGEDDIECGPGMSGRGKGKGVALDPEDWLGLSEGAKEDDVDGWWRLWEVGAECKEIGAMDCYGVSIGTERLSLQLIAGPHLRRMPSRDDRAVSASPIRISGTH